jgi:predicted metallopeptidase
MVKYIESKKIKERAIFLASKHSLDWLDFDRIFFYTYMSNTRTVAKCVGFSKVLQLPNPYIAPYYVIVFNERHFNDKMSRQEKDSTILHELLHIPKNFSGEFSNLAHRKIHKLANELSKR